MDPLKSRTDPLKSSRADPLRPRSRGARRGGGPLRKSEVPDPAGAPRPAGGAGPIGGPRRTPGGRQVSEARPRGHAGGPHAVLGGASGGENGGEGALPIREQ
eukprot:1186043-Prorocentrum_minimum.AAC.5